MANTPGPKLREALESLATPEARKKIQLDINYLLDHPDEIVPYFTSKDADEVLLLVGNVLKGQKVDPYNLTPAQQNAIKAALETNKVDNWMARKYKKSKADRDEVRVAWNVSCWCVVWPSHRVCCTCVGPMVDLLRCLPCSAPCCSVEPPSPKEDPTHHHHQAAVAPPIVLPQVMQQTPPAELPPQTPLTPEQMRDYMGPYPKLARGNGTIKVTSPPQTVTEMLKSIQHFNPKSGVKSQPKFGMLKGFTPMRVPVVFHCE